MAYIFNLNMDTDKYEVRMDASQSYGYFENNKSGAGGGLWFSVEDVADNGEVQWRLEDYDGVYQLPLEVIETLKAHLNIIIGPEFYPD